VRQIVDPFLHVLPDRIEHPITGRTTRAGEPVYEVLRRLMTAGEAESLSEHERAPLLADGWLVEADDRLAARFRLRIVSLETHSHCNQACYFCPVSVDPRADAAMSDELFESIAGQLTAFAPTLEAVFLSNYNEPTADAGFVNRCKALSQHGLPIALNTNASGLTPARVDALSALGPLRLVSVNLSTLDRARYAKERGADHLELVLRNLDHAATHLLAAEMIIVVLGVGDEQHTRDVEAIAARFAGTRFAVQAHRIMDRAGYLSIGLKPETGHTHLRGCDNLGSRPLQHLHITASGRCVFCCEDYDEHHVVGDLRTSTVVEVLAGEAIARLRRWSYGLEDAPQQFMCRQCVFAIAR
jgi:hypothetical protein